MKKFIILFVAVVAGLIGWRLTIETTAEKYRGKVIIRWITDANPARKEQIEEFERSNPDIHVVWDFAESAPRKTMIQISGRRGPDLFDNYSPQDFYQFASAGALYDLTSLIEKDVEKTREINHQRHLSNLRLEKEIGIEKEPGSLANLGEPPVNSSDARSLHPYNLRILELKSRYAKAAPLVLLEYPLIPDIFWPGMQENLVFNGKLVGVPTNMAPPMVTYNKDVFDRNGVSYPQADWTVEEFLETCRRLSVKSPGSNTYQSFAIAGDWAQPEVFLYLAGGRVFSPDKKECLLANPRALKAFSAAGAIFSPPAGWPRLAPTAVDSLAGATSSLDIFPNLTNGKIAMIFAGRWPLSFTGPAFNYGVVPLPRFTDTPEEKRKVMFVGRITAMSRDTRHPEEAFRFLKFLASREYGKILVRGGDGGSGVRYYREEPWALFDPEFPEVASRMCARIRKRAQVSGKPDPFEGLSNEEMTSLARAEWNSLGESEKSNTREEITREMRTFYDEAERGMMLEFSPYISASRLRVAQMLLLERVQNGTVRPEQWATELAKILDKYLAEELNPDPKRTRRYAIANRIGWFVLAASFVLGASIYFLRRRRIKRVKEAGFNRRETLVATGFLLPNFGGFIVFTLFPVVFSFIIAFTDFNTLTNQIRYVGFNNFVDILFDRDFWYHAFNTLVFMLGLPISMAASLFLAILLSKKLRGYIAFRTLFYLPSVVSGVAILLLWKWIYNPDFGLLNAFLRNIGFDDPPKWLTGMGQILGIKFYWAKPALIAMGVWMSMGGPSMLLYLAGLTSIPPELYEAAGVDGASPLQRFRYITWPLLSPTTFFIFVIGIIGGLQGGFEMAYVMTQGGPEQSTTTIGYDIYRMAFFEFRMGAAAGVAWFLFLMILVVTIINWRFGEKTVHYV